MIPTRTLLRGPDGLPLLPSATLRADGRPRFVLPLVPHLIQSDGGIRHLVNRELHHDGFERMTRDLLDAHLEEGDLFIDAGAHWGVMSLSAVTAPAGGVRAIAIEPHPSNVAVLMQAISVNQMADSIVVVSGAAGEGSSILQLQLGTTMGHSLRPSARTGGIRRGLHVPVIAIDDLLASVGRRTANRIVIKVDVEGFEPEVLLGAKETIESGHVALIIWERGMDYRNNEETRAKANAAADWLSGLGFRHYNFPYHEWGGPLIPTTHDWYFSNIMSFAPGVDKRPVYPQDFSTRPPFEAIHRMVRSPERVAEVARMSIAANASDGIRWADPQQLEAGAVARAVAAAHYITTPTRVLDLGAGNMALARHLQPGSAYQPADIISRSENCLIADLNQAQFPEGEYGVVTLLDVLEYVHDIAALLKRCRAAAPQLVLTYRTSDTGEIGPRRNHGLLNDLTPGSLAAIVEHTGFDIRVRTFCEGAQVLNCVAH